MSNRRTKPTGAAWGRMARAALDLRWVAEQLEARLLLSASLVDKATEIPFQEFTIDPTPGTVPVVKVFADLNGDGKKDAVVGHSTSLNGGGLDWYAFPKSGNPADPWIKHNIDPKANIYESAQPFDVNHDNAMDLVVSSNGQIVWYENPLGHGGDPTVSGWTKHVIGNVTGHEMSLADIDGDGLMDVVTNDGIFFQKTSDIWVQATGFNRTQKGMTLYDDGSGLGAVDIAGTGEGPNFNVGFWQNPRSQQW